MSSLFAFAMPGTTELVIVGVVCVLLFGKRLPKLAYDFGSSFTQFKRGLTMPMEELEDCSDSLRKETSEFKKTVNNEKRSVEEAIRNV